MTRAVDAHGTYGLRLIGIDGAARLLSPAAAGWPDLHIERRTGCDPRESNSFDEEVVRYHLQSGGSVTIDRAAQEVVFCMADPPSDEEVVHPFLFAAAATMSRWLGRETFHSGAFVADGGAWAVLGAKGSGKSSTLGWLASRDVVVLSDDLLVVDDGDALAGPSCIDLRPDAAACLGVGENLGVVGTRERWRLVTPKAPDRLPLRGWVFPAWDDEVALVPVPVAERLPRLMENLALRVPPLRPDRILDLAALPCWALRRPRSWDSLDPAVDRLLEAICG
ncbi:MAG: hypothetical protein ACRDYX_01150 [Egibacteraceae bacterium]